MSLLIMPTALRAGYYSRLRFHNLVLYIIAALLAHGAGSLADRDALANFVLFVLLGGPVELGLFFFGGVVEVDGDFLAELGINVLLSDGAH